MSKFMRERLKNKKKRYFILIAIVLVTFIFSFGYIIAKGHTYTAKMICRNSSINLSDIKIVNKNEDIIKIENLELKNTDENTFINLTLKAQKAGDAEVQCTYPYSGEEIFDETLEFTVLPFNIIYDRIIENFSGFEVLSPSIFVIMISCLVVFGMTFFEHTRKGTYSYSSVALGGIILYNIGTIMSFFAFMLLFYNSFQLYNFFDLISIVMLNGLFYSALVFPALLLLSLALGVSNIWLVKHEGFRPLNLLGVFLGVTIIVGFFLIMRMFFIDFEGDETQIKVYSAFIIAATYIFCYFVNMLFSTIICSVFSVGYNVPYNIDYIIILGCAIRKDGTPTPILRGRIDRAIEFERKQFEITGKHAVFVPSGGQGSDEVVSEAECMKQYLISQGIPEEQILPEDKSVNTYQNMLFSKHLIEKQAESLDDVNIAFSTTNYHVFRGYTIAKRVKMTAKGLSAKTKLYFFPNAFVREFIGLLYSERWRHLAFLLMIVFIYSVLAFLL